MNNKINEIIKILQDAIIYSRNNITTKLITKAIEELRKLENKK